ncbi:hypothetical protein QFW77_18555 [Luteimonas sp. RD2P54]|uniref:Uncharacterized protein n=1 Tax=Luteimonas endophytica TaxID=3042023 RepID=A0ABT6JDR8_9GAMM|nr:hypothetical protein [Luteimonas endophytica]MDH5824972.1 hypothetical protein [Luteimonas endophytica]
MSIPVDHVASTQTFALPQQAPASASSYQDGRAAGEEIAELVPANMKYNSTEIPMLVDHFSGDLTAALEQAGNDPEFAAGFVEALGPERFSRLVAAVDQIPNTQFPGSDPQVTRDTTELLQSLAVALGAATRSPQGAIDAAFVREIASHNGFVADGGLDPELAAILLNGGDYTPQTAAELGAHVFLEGEPPQIMDRPEGSLPVPAHREPLLKPAGHDVGWDNTGAWATALHGILRNQAASEVLAIRGDGPHDASVAERLLDPGIKPDSLTVISPLVGAVLDTPRTNLATNPNDQAAIAAVESLVLASHAHNGRVGDWAQAPLGQLYMTYPGEILNVGEGSAAFPASSSPLGERLAGLGAEYSGAGANLMTAALGADGTPPLRLDQPQGAPPFMVPAERYDSWEQAIHAATDHYRAQVQDYGPPRETDVQGAPYIDLEDLADEIADIDAELVQAQFGANAIAATDVDNDHQARQDAVNVISDYIGFGIGLGTGGASRAAFATGYNTHVEGALLEALWPTSNASQVFENEVPGFARELVAAQTVQIVEAAARSGAVELPESLRDPDTGGLRTPASDADGAQFAEDLAGFVAGNPALQQAVDQAASNLMARVNALRAGDYRGGG